MPFWWNRRRRPWYGRWYQRRNRKYKKRRFRKRRRRWPRRTTRRRRRTRRKKVRRKKQKLFLQQWQPDTIRKCKIKGTGIHIIGGNGAQFNCFTPNRFNWTPPLMPGGGGFGVETYSLQHLYNEHKLQNNIWTQSNKNLELVRYTGCWFKFYRHETIDFIVQYSRQLPMSLEKYTYPDSHPNSLLHSKHKKIIPSLKTKKHGKRYVKIKIKPTKQLSNKWLFQETYANAPLLKLTSSIIDLRYPHISQIGQNELVSIFCLNTDFYANAGWGNSSPPGTQHTNWYQPYANVASITKVRIKGKEVPITIQKTPYKSSINYETGWFQTKLLQAEAILDTPSSNIPVAAARYNPTKDDGAGNKVWLVNVVNYSYGPPKTDLDLFIEGLPLWQLYWGFLDFVKQTKKDSTFLNTYYTVFESKYLEPAVSTSKLYIPIDISFINGKGPYDSYVTSYRKDNWYPTLNAQLKTINAIVQAGPFVPKLDNIFLSSWELYSNYQFFFKFGGSELPEPDTVDPEKQGTYEVPSKIKSAVQIINPQKQNACAALHSWDYRRGVITSTAYKRMLENQETDTEFEYPTEQPPQKKKKTQYGNALQRADQETEEIQDCLLSLCEEATFQNFQEENILNLIQQQQQQQQHLKQQFLTLLSDLKKKQRALQLQTGLLD
nr:MAG: ORF1 [Torque teno midi virus]